MEITNEIKAKVFAQYLGQQVQVRRKYDSNKDYLVGRICEVTLKSNHGDWVQVWFDDVYTVTNNNHNESSSNSHYFFFGEDHTKLILRPLSEITDEDAVECLKIAYHSVYGYVDGIEECEVLCDENSFGLICYNKEFDNERISLTVGKEIDFWINGDRMNCPDIFIFQYLQSKGYDLSNYLLGGKTLKEAGLAVYVCG